MIVVIVVSPRLAGVRFAAPVLLAWDRSDLASFIRSPTYLVGNAAIAVVVLVWAWWTGILSVRFLGQPKRGLEPHSGFVWFSCGALIWFSHIAAAALVAGFSGVTTLAGASLRAQTTLLLAAYGISVTVAVILAYLVNASAPKAGLTASPKSLLRGILLLVTAWPIVTCIGVACLWIHKAMGLGHPDSVAHPTLQALLDHPRDPWAWAQNGIAIFVAPIQEELIYRGFIQSAAVKAMGQVWAGVGITSLLFAAAHISGNSEIPWYAITALFVLSLCIGTAFERTGKLGVAIGMHMAFNGLNVLLTILGA